MSKRFRMLLGTTIVLAIGAVGGIAAAEQGGSSADHRQNPTTTSEPTVDTTSTTTTVAPEPQGAEDRQADPAEDSNRAEALCWALQQGSEQGQAMKAERGHAFHDLECADTAARPGDDESDEAGDAGDEGQGPPESPGQSGEHGGGPDNPNAQGHGKQ